MTEEFFGVASERDDVVGQSPRGLIYSSSAIA